MRQVSRLIGWSLLSALVSPMALAQFGHGKHEEEPAPWSQADEYWNAREMQESRAAVLHHHGDLNIWALQVHRAELAFHEDETVGVIDADVWYGGDLNKLYLKTEGEFSFEEDDFEELEVQALWSRAISPFFDFQAGVRYDLEPKGRTHAVVGFQGMAPYRFEIDTAAYLSDRGDVTGDIEVEYELALTQRLHIKPRAELGWSAQDIDGLEIKSGLTNAAAGLRLSYDVVREFSPYVGVEWSGSLGGTRDLIEATGEDAGATAFVIGFHAWY